MKLEARRANYANPTELELKVFQADANKPCPVRGECYYLGTPKVLKNCNCYANEDHICELGKPNAVPLGNCQTCNEWEEK